MAMVPVTVVLLLSMVAPVGWCQSNNQPIQPGTYYLDSNADCNGPVREIYAQKVRVIGHGTIQEQQSPQSCTLQLRSTSALEQTQLRIEVVAATIRDCDVRVSISDGDPGQNIMRGFDCNSPTKPNERDYVTTGDLVSITLTRRDSINTLFDIEFFVTPLTVYALDRQSTCGKEITVYENELTLTARSNVAPANPPLECIVYLQSAFEVADGRYRLQIIVEQLQIEDCKVSLAIFNGRGYTGNYLRQLGCSSGSTDIIYTTGSQATMRFSRPQNLNQTAYAVTLTIKTYADGDVKGTAVGLDKLSTGAIIGIVVGVVVLIALRQA